MQETLLNTLTSLVDKQSLGEAATQLGESEHSVFRGFQTACAAILGGLAGKASNSNIMTQAFDLISSPTNDGRVIDNPSSLMSGAPSAGPMLDMGKKFLGLVFGGDQSAVAEAIGRTAGLRTQSVSSLLSFVAPLALGVLGRKVRSSNMNFGSFTRMLQAEAPSLSSALPASLNNLLGFSDVGRVPAAQVVEAPTSANRWVLPLLACLALLSGLIWLANRGAHRTAIETARSAADRQAADQARIPSPLGDMVTRKLPTGIDLTVPQRGVEIRFLDFVQNPATAAAKDTWFNFDRLYFEKGSAALEPESHEQLANEAEILKAYPTVRVLIGGFTDNSGDAQANLRLSQERANSVVRELTRMGVAPDRMVARGYGEQRPVADNSTEEGRAKNRRIAIHVTQR